MLTRISEFDAFLLVYNIYCCYVLFIAPKVELVEWNRYTVTWEALEAMKGDPIVYALQLLRGREVEQVWKGASNVSVTSPHRYTEYHVHIYCNPCCFQSKSLTTAFVVCV